MKLHQEIVLRHLPVDVQLGELNSCVFLHRFDDVGDLVGNRLECGPDDVIFSRESCQPTNDSENVELLLDKRVERALIRNFGFRFSLNG